MLTAASCASNDKGIKLWVFSGVAQDTVLLDSMGNDLVAILAISCAALVTIDGLPTKSKTWPSMDLWASPMVVGIHQAAKRVAH